MEAVKLVKVHSTETVNVSTLGLAKYSECDFQFYPD